MNLVKKYCGPEAVSEVMFTDLMTDIAENDPDDVLIFQVKGADKNICVSKAELQEFWSHESGWNWGNCRDDYGRPISDRDFQLSQSNMASIYCSKYYKIPSMNLYIPDLNSENVLFQPIQVWILSNSGEIRSIGRNMNVSSEYNNPREKIWKLCPKSDPECDYTETRYNGPYTYIDIYGDKITIYWENGNATGKLVRSLDGKCKRYESLVKGVKNGIQKIWSNNSTTTDYKSDIGLERKFTMINGKKHGSEIIYSYETDPITEMELTWENGIQKDNVKLWEIKGGSRVLTNTISL